MRHFLVIYRALDKPAYRVKYQNIWKDLHLFKFLSIFSERNVRNVIFRFLFTRLGKGRGNPNWFPFGYVRFIMETSQIFVTAF